MVERLVAGNGRGFMGKVLQGLLLEADHPVQQPAHAGTSPQPDGPVRRVADLPPAGSSHATPGPSRGTGIPPAALGVPDRDLNPLAWGQMTRWEGFRLPGTYLPWAGSAVPLPVGG
jgi:hypothetical protein